MRPGAPVGFGILGSVPWIGLPGNPVSTMVTFELFVRPAIRRMAGHSLPFRRSVPVRLGETVSLKPRLQHFLRVTLTDTPEGVEARLTGPQGSGILMSMVLADALLVIPEGQFETPAGSTAQALRLDDATSKCPAELVMRTNAKRAGLQPPRPSGHRRRSRARQPTRSACDPARFLLSNSCPSPPSTHRLW